MPRVSMSFTAGLVLFLTLGLPLTASPQEARDLAPVPKTVTMSQLAHRSALDGQVVQLNGVVVRHTDTAQVFTLGDKEGPEIHVVIPNPAIDAAHVGDEVAVVGTVRKYDAKEFERDYRWFRQSDYPHFAGGTWVIVARSVRTPEGTELVPTGTVSDMPKK